MLEMRRLVIIIDGTIMRKVEIETTTTITDGHPRHHTAAAVERAVIEIAIARDIVLQIMTVAAAVAVLAVAEVEAVTVTVIAIDPARKVERLSWKDCRWTWLKKTFDSTFPSFASSAKHLRSIYIFVETRS